MKAGVEEFGSFLEKESGKEEKMRQFNYYASNVCLTLLKEFVQHACLDEKQKRMVDEVVFAFQYVQEVSWGRDASNLENFDQEAAMRVLNGLHEFATILPFLNKAYIQIDDGAYEDTSGAIAAQILPSLKGYMECVRSFPGYFNRMYPEPKKRHARWNKALRKMEYAFECKHSVNHVFLSPTSIINFTSKKQSYDDTRRSSRDNELLQRAQSDL